MTVTADFTSKLRPVMEHRKMPSPGRFALQVRGTTGSCHLAQGFGRCSRYTQQLLLVHGLPRASGYLWCHFWKYLQHKCGQFGTETGVAHWVLLAGGVQGFTAKHDAAWHGSWSLTSSSRGAAAAPWCPESHHPSSEEPRKIIDWQVLCPGM